MRKSLLLRYFGAMAVSLLCGAAVFMIANGQTAASKQLAAVSKVLRRPVGQPQLISIQPLPEMEENLCPLAPASASETLLEAIQQSQATGMPAPGRNPEVVDRAPARVIRDTYPTYSAVALDLTTNEVLLQDENLFGIKKFDRMSNTPPEAAFTEPKRELAGGATTKLEFNCGLYVDPKTGDIYSVANDTVDTLVVFPRSAEGNVPPMRELTTPHRTWGIAVDEEANEMFLTTQHPARVVVYRKDAQGQEKPLRIIEGTRTGLEDAHGISLDTKNGWIFVSNQGHFGNPKVAGSGRNDPPSITVYPLKGSGDIPPIRTIEGPKTQLNWPGHLFVDEEHGEIYVANDAAHSILVFRTTDSGDVAPSRAIRGAKTQLRSPTGIFLDKQNDELWVSNMGNHRATVYPRTANGDVPPKRVIRSAPEGKRAQMIGNPGGVAYDSKRNEILVPN
ncbi:MAG: hypothetical protein HYX73_00905 [Acidobacteria bacterium]|nr:hypothetical protein [Acidobacteriota bacterium]